MFRVARCTDFLVPSVCISREVCDSQGKSDILTLLSLGNDFKSKKLRVDFRVVWVVAAFVHERGARAIDRCRVADAGPLH